MTDYGREAWVWSGYPIVGPEPRWHSLVTPVAHHSGAETIPADSSSWLRAMQRDWTDRKGYSLGYGWLIEQGGDSYEIRGADYRNASNAGAGNDNANDWSTSFLFGTRSPGEPASDAAIATANRLWHTRVVPRCWNEPTGWIGHTEIDATACPGHGNIARLAAGDFDTQPPTTGGPMQYLNPARRILDSRLLGDKPQGQRTITVPPEIPATEAIMLTLTAVEPDGNGYVTVWSQGPRPDASHLNYTPPTPIANTTVTPLDRTGATFQLYLHTPTHIVIDIVGYQ